MDDVIHRVAKHGAGVFMAKFDVEAAYQHIPVHLTTGSYEGLNDVANSSFGSSFGLRSAPFIFDSAASMVESIIVNYMVLDLQHHLDDSILADPPDPPICASTCPQP